jgi:hypothetical protein
VSESTKPSWLGLELEDERGSIGRLTNWTLVFAKLATTGLIAMDTGCGWTISNVIVSHASLISAAPTGALSWSKYVTVPAASTFLGEVWGPWLDVGVPLVIRNDPNFMPPSCL